ncbi:hypothetical protein [Lysobacter firmicutimachus]|uniref:Uncharacterized protein n=1 Tax=Lysobacter firmicutimachus TaxID=1792846 RepID=A0ABU8CZC5_9GAMM
MQKNTVATPVETHVLMLMVKPEGGERTMGHKRPETGPAPTLGHGVARAAQAETSLPMSAVTSDPNSLPSPIVATCVELGEEQLISHDLIDRLVKRLLPVLAREAPSGTVTPTINALPPVLSAQSPLHSDLQDRVKRQREINRRLRSLLERVVV